MKFTLTVELKNLEHCDGCPAYHEFDHPGDLGVEVGECGVTGRYVKEARRPDSCPLEVRDELV